MFFKKKKENREQVAPAKPNKTICGELVEEPVIGQPARVQTAMGLYVTSNVVRYLRQTDGRVWLETANTCYWIGEVSEEDGL